MATRELGITLVIFGALLFIGAAVAYSYQQPRSETISGYTVQLPPTEPFRDDAFPLIIGGVALFVLGFALMVYPSQKQNPQPPSQITSPSIKYCCKSCGAAVSPNQRYCPQCGRQLEWH